MRSFPLFFGLLGVAGALASGTLFVACSDGGSSAGGDPNRYASASHALTVNSGGGVTVSVPPASDSADPRVRSLLVRAAVECGVGNVQDASSSKIRFAPSLRRKRVAFAGNGVPFESSSGVPVATCDERLEEAEALVCMADRFAAIADAVGELHWNETPSSYATGAVGAGVSDLGIGFPPYHGLCRSTTNAVV
jgi:hypothetical protein